MTEDCNGVGIVEIRKETMEISYFFKNMESSDAMKDYAHQKMRKLSEHFDSNFNANVRFRVEKIHQIVEFDVQGDGNQYVAEEKASDMYAAMDQLEKVLERQIRRNKEKNLDRKHRSQ